jgi:hypothetical protein
MIARPSYRTFFVSIQRQQEKRMAHKFNTGTTVYYDGGTLAPGARSAYKIVRPLPVEMNNKLLYRIKSVAESFERTAEEHQLSHAD